MFRKIAGFVMCAAAAGTLSMATAGAAIAETTKIRYFQTDPTRHGYRIELLELALRKTEGTDGPFELVPDTSKISPARGLEMLESGDTDLVFLPTSKDMEQRFLPIRVPLLRGLLGYRISLVHKDDAERFATIKSLDELRSQFTAGFGSQWADMAVLEGNGLKVDGSVEYELIFKKLQEGRVNYFPRGVSEVWGEIEGKGKDYPDIRVDEKIALYYPLATYFFVNKNNSKLADRIGRGLAEAENDGSFKELFLKHYKDVIERARLSERRVFELTNPNLPEGTVIDTSWWLKR